MCEHIYKFVTKPGHGLLAAHRVNVQVQQRCHLVGWLSRNNRTDGGDKECPKTIDIALSWKIGYSRSYCTRWTT